jgi:predicted  nucleic acid-binding Zn ribbon protein
LNSRTNANANGASSLSSNGSLSDIVSIKEEISDIQARLSKMGKMLKKFIETSSENHKEVKTMIARQQQSKNEIRKNASK